MKKEYRPEEIEARHYERWESAGWFAPSGQGEPYCIVIPPPNVTGTLHMGHALQDTIMDALTRYHRMRGRNALWQPGTDHAGIATQMVVERLLEREGTSRKELGRERFLERVWQWKERSGNTIVRQMRRLGASVDWSRERFTMDAELSRAVVEVFVRLHDEGLIYRGKRLVNWDPVLRTAVSDLEVLSTEERGKLWHLRYPIEGGIEGAYVVVATTRPETMLGDTAVAVHPEDERYKQWVGKHVRLPLADRLIPIIADEYVDREFGTGVLKITPAHDFNDYEVGLRHNLPLVSVLDEAAHLNDAAPPRYRGLDRFVARERVLEDLAAAGLLEKTEDHVSMIPRGDRSGVVIEPLLTDQWYVRTKPLAEPAIAAVEDGRVRFVPEGWTKTYFEWMHNIQDWCISRQLWWGHRIPAWYDERGNAYVARDEQEVRAKHGLGASVRLRQDEDVLDTWFSSALWPFSTLGWPDKTDALATFYPTNVLVTSFDIIFFWVARMIMLGMKFAGDVPFREVYIHALVRDHEGQKMSKSKGNVLDPLDLIDGVDLETLLKKRTEGLMQAHLQAGIERVTRKEFPNGIEGVGTDALRLTFASLATTGRDARFDLARAEGYHRFCNKLWNASAYVLSQLGGTPDGAATLSVADRWILSRLHGVIREVHASYATYRLDLVAQVLYDFAWHELCDWYLELAKAVLTDPGADPARKRGTQQTLVAALGALLKLLHPLIPFVTEELWLELCRQTGRDSKTVMLEPFPVEGDAAYDAEAEAEVEWLKTFVVGIRQIRGDSNLPRSTALTVQLADATALDDERVDRHRAQLTRLAGIERIEMLAPGAAVKGAATALLGGMRILVPLAGLIDVAAERDRLGKQLARTRDDLAKSRRKLENQSFVANAPPDVVAKENARVADFEQRTAQLEQQLARLADLA
ncbi:MAG TPA: valine--tRNA ligase [Gammaproteobacteria bacterium]|nr:valine--tRNA ligase [Gammaproteobacteria bacterium]